MRRLREHSGLRRFLQVWVTLGLLLQGMAAHAVPILDDGICRADAPASDGKSPAHPHHDDCCVLGHAPAIGATPELVELPLPRAPAMRPAERFFIAAAPAAASPAAYASRAPPRA